MFFQTWKTDQNSFRLDSYQRSQRGIILIVSLIFAQKNNFEGVSSATQAVSEHLIGPHHLWSKMAVMARLNALFLVILTFFYGSLGEQIEGVVPLNAATFDKVTLEICDVVLYFYLCNSLENYHLSNLISSDNLETRQKNITKRVVKRYNALFTTD